MEKPAGGIRDKLRKLDRTLNEHGVLGDSALPVSGDMKKRQFVTLLKRGDFEREINGGGDGVRIATMNNAVISIRQDDEWRMVALDKFSRECRYHCHITQRFTINN